MKKKYLYYLFPLAGVIFCLWYLHLAVVDVVYSDYIRLVNSYLPDVWNLDKFFVPDVLTRVPANYLGRIINVELFGYNLNFDRILGVIGLGLSALVIARFCLRKRIGLGWLAILMIVMFSLNKWEMLINGSGWPHFMAFAGFYYHYHVMDRVWAGQERNYDRKLLIFLPLFNVIFIAGPYCAIYSVTVILASGFFFFIGKSCRKKEDNRWLIYAGVMLAALFLYMVSNSFAVEDHAAPADTTLLQQLMDTPGYFIRFLLTSFSSMVIGIERALLVFSTNLPFMVLGGLVIVAYILALWLNWHYRLYKETIVPLILLISGGLNHVLVLLSRWIFLQENYGASSRYALQFQAGILGIIITFALVWKKMKKDKVYVIRGAAAAVCIMFVIGNGYTTYHEWLKAPDRKASFESMREMALDFENRTDDELRGKFEYRMSTPGSGAAVRKALTILKENGWNVFREEN